jgi:hypothetical protein
MHAAAQEQCCNFHHICSVLCCCLQDQKLLESY